MKTKALTILLSIAILMLGSSMKSIAHAAEKSPANLSLDIVGLVDKPGRVAISEDETVENLFKAVKPNPFASTQSIFGMISVRGEVQQVTNPWRLWLPLMFPEH